MHKVIATTTTGTTTPSHTRYLHYDHLGSVDAITSDTGTLAERLSYDAWGKRRQPNGLDAATVIAPATTHHGYTGHEHLDGLGLIHMNARVYDPNIGRFASADPIGFEGGLDVYGYANDNPLNFTDPSGLAPPINNPGTEYITGNVHYAEQIWNPGTFYNLVKPGGQWDFKRIDPEKWEEFGNYMYGVTGAATGLFSEDTLLREAGKAQVRSGTSAVRWGTPLNGFRGDDIVDHYWTREGIKDYYSGMYGEPDASKLLGLLPSATSAYSWFDAVINYRTPDDSWYRNNPEAFGIGTVE